jgi:hypothetical protein
MKYANYITIPNFEKHKADLLEFRQTHGNTDTYWDNYQDEEIAKLFPNLVKEFKDSLSNFDENMEIFYNEPIIGALIPVDWILSQKQIIQLKDGNFYTEEEYKDLDRHTTYTINYLCRTVAEEKHGGCVQAESKRSCTCGDEKTDCSVKNFCKFTRKRFPQ